MNLLEAKQRTFYAVKDVGGDEFLRRRLLDIGFTPDTKLYLAAVAPFGGTVLIGLRGCLVALRENAASLIEIEVCHD